MGSFKSDGEDRNPGRRRGSKPGRKRVVPRLEAESLEARQLMAGPGDQAPAWRPTSLDPADLKNGPLARAGQELAGVYREFQSFQMSGRPVEQFQSSNPSLRVRNGTVAVTINAYGDLTTYSNAANAATGFNESARSAKNGLLEGWVPIQNLPALAQLSQVNPTTGKPLYQTVGLFPNATPETRSQGSVANQAEQNFGLTTALTQFPGVTGSGITYGVLSDSVNRFGGGLNASIATGDLPPLSRINVIQDEPVGGNNSDEGRAMLELMYDLAPGANLAFNTAFNGQIGFADGIRALSAAGSQVIVDDVGYRDEPFYQPGPIEQAITQVVRQQNRMFFSAAGNSADKGFETPFRPTQATVAGITGTFLDFDPGAGVVTSLPITVTAAGQFTMQFDQAWYTANGVTSDVDVLVLDANGNIVAQGNQNNVATQTPQEVITIGATGNYTVAIVVRSGSAPGRVQMVSWTADIDFSKQFGSTGGITYPTSYGHSASPDAIGVGAVFAYDAAPLGTQNPLQNETFSSTGPAYRAFDASGNRLPAVQTLQRPQLSGIDGTDTTFFGQVIPQDGNQFPNFFGTSAAAPNLASLAVLMRQISPNVTQDAVLQAFIASAKPLNGSAAGTWNAQGGFGLPDALKSFQAVDRLRVQAVNVPNGSTQGALPTEISFVLNKNVNPATVQASDLQFTALPAGVTVQVTGTYVQDNIVVFLVKFNRGAGTKANGNYAYRLADNSMSTTDGKGLAQFAGTFAVSDLVSPKVTSTAYSGRLVRVTFSESMDPATINAANVVLQRTGSSGTWNNPSNVTLTSLAGAVVKLEKPNVALIDLSALPQSQLPSDRYRLVVSDFVTDLVGNRLDGNFANGVFPSGDNKPLPQEDNDADPFVQDLGFVTLQAPQILYLSLDAASDSGLKPDQNTNVTRPSFIGQLTAAFPGTTAGLQVVGQFNALHGGTFDLARDPSGRGYRVGSSIDVSTITAADGTFRFQAPATLTDGFHVLRIVAINQPDQPPLPGFSTQFDQAFRIDTTTPNLAPINVQPNTKLSTLKGGISLRVTDPVQPTATGNFLAVPTQFVVPALDPSRATNISNYSLINLGADGVLSPGDADLSNYITGAVYTDTTNRLVPGDPYTGRVDLSFAEGLPAGKYLLVVRQPQAAFPGVTDAAANPIDGDPNTPGVQDYVLPFEFQPTPVFITNFLALSPLASGQPGFTGTGPRAFYEVPQPGTTPRADAPPDSFVIDFSTSLQGGVDYGNKFWLIRSADSPTAASDGDFGTDPSFATSTGFTRVTGLSVQLRNSVLGAQPGDPGYQNRLVITVPSGTTLPADKYRLYIPNQVLNGQDLRVFDAFGNWLDGEFRGNQNAGGGWETLLPTGIKRPGLTGDQTAGGSFETALTVVPNGNVFFVKPDIADDPLLSSDDPDGSRARPFGTLAAEAIPNALNGGNLNSSLNFSTGFNPNLDLNGNGRFDRSAFYAATVASSRGPVVVVTLPSTPGDPLNRTLVLQKPGQNPAQPTIPDGSGSVPFNTTLVMQPGSILKMRDASLFVQNQGSAIQLLGGPNPNDRVYVTSYFDDSIGGDTNRDGAPRPGGTGAQPFAGDYGGIVLRNFNDVLGGGRPIPVAPGPDDPTRPQTDGRTRLGLSGADDALSIVNFANLRYAGGAVPQSIGFRFDGITLFNSRPAITNTVIDGFQSTDGATGPNGGSQGGISGDLDSFREDELTAGPLIRNTTIQRTSINGIYVRAELNGVIEPTNAIIYPDRPTTQGGQQNYTFDDPLPYVFVSRLVVGQRLQHNSGLAEVPFGTRVNVSPGMILKFQRGAGVEVLNPAGTRPGSLVFGDRTLMSQFDLNPAVAPTDAGFVAQKVGDARIIVTSFFDDAATTEFVDPNTGVKTTIVAAIDSDNSTQNVPSPGNVPALARWGSFGINSGARVVLDEVEFRYGGGTVNQANGTIPQRDVLNFQGDFSTLGTRAYVTNNNFYDNLEAPIGITPNGLLAADPLRPLQSGNPFFRGNIMQRNDVNGLEIIPANQGVTNAYAPNLSVNSVWDDTDSTYVLRGTIRPSGGEQDLPGFGGIDVPTSYGRQLKAALTLTIQAGLPDTLLADGTRIAKPGEAGLVKLLNTRTTVLGDGILGMPGGNVGSNVFGGAGFLFGFDNGVDPTADPLLDPGFFTQLRITGIGGNETTGQPRVPVTITSLRDDSVGRTIRGVNLNSSASAAYLASVGFAGAAAAGDGGVIGFGAHTLSDYNLMDPRDGNLIDNADIRYISRIEMQGGGWVYVGQGDASGFNNGKTGNFDPLEQFNTSKAMTISNSNLSTFSQAGVIAHPSYVPQIHLLLNPSAGTVPLARGTTMGQSVVTLMYNNTLSNMPTGVRINSETVNNDLAPSPYVGVLLNNTFSNVGEGVHTEAPNDNGLNSLSHVYFLAMNNIFSGSTDTAVRTVGMATGSQLLYNLFNGNAADTAQTGTAYTRAPFNAQPVNGNPQFRNPGAGDYSLTSLSDAIDAAISEVKQSNWGMYVRPIVTQVLNSDGGIRITNGGRRRFVGGLIDISVPGDIVTQPGYPPDQRGYIDQFVPAISTTPGAVAGPSLAGGQGFFYVPISGERDALGFLRQDDPNKGNVGFGSRPFFDIGAFEYRQLFPMHVVDVTATMPGPVANPISPTQPNVQRLYVPGGIGGSNVTPVSIRIPLDQKADPATVTDKTVLLQASGGDGIFGNANNSQDRFITLSGKVSYDDATASIVVGLAGLGLNLSNDLYRIIVRGNGDPVVRNTQGLALDGENTVGADPNGAQLPLPSGDGIPGGDFQVTFSIDTSAPTIVAGSFKLGPQAAPDPRPDDNITSAPLPTFVGRIFDVPPPQNPLLGQTVIIDISSKGDGVFDVPNAGTGATDAQGNFSVTLTKAIPDTAYNVGPDGLLGTADDSGYSVARVRIVDAGGNTSPTGADYLTSFVVDTKGPRVTGTDPVPGTLANVGGGSLQVAIAVNENLESTTLTTSSLKVIRSGGDGIFGNGNDVPITVDPATIVLEPLKSAGGAMILRFTATGVTANDLYRVVLDGSSTGVRDVAGNAIDGEQPTGLPSGNGTPGGDFNLDFVVLNPTTTRIIYASAGASGGTPTGTRSNPYPSITAALAAANIGDTVGVIGGTTSGQAVVYNETVTLKSLVKLVSADPTSTDANLVPGLALKTVIRPDAVAGRASRSVVGNNLVSLPSFVTEVRGFTLASPLAGNTQTGPILTDALAVELNNSDVLIDRNYIITSYAGIGIGLGGAARTPRIENNAIIGNYHGVVVNVVAPITSIINNRPVQIVNNTVAFNTYGTTVVAAATAPFVADFANNLFSQNAARSSTREGAAILATATGKARLRNNLFTGNGPSATSPADDTVGLGGGFNPATLTGTPDANGNLTGAAIFYSPIDPRPEGNGPGNFYLGANYDITSGSTGAIDNGLSNSEAPTTDFRFRGRVDIANRGFAGPVDIGAFEYNGTGGIGSGAVGSSGTGTTGSGGLVGTRSATTSTAFGTIDPAFGAGVASVSTAGNSVTMRFNAAVNRSTVQATDLLISGDGLDPSNPAHPVSLSWIDSKTVQFNLDGSFRSSGTVRLDLPPGAITNADKSLVPEFGKDLTVAEVKGQPVGSTLVTPAAAPAITVATPVIPATPTPEAARAARLAAQRQAQADAQVAAQARRSSLLSRLSTRLTRKPGQPA